jgi:hypothetical protein
MRALVGQNKRFLVRKEKNRDRNPAISPKDLLCRQIRCVAEQR